MKTVKYKLGKWWLINSFGVECAVFESKAKAQNYLLELQLRALNTHE